jgi:prevent-host-death family protein
MKTVPLSEVKNNLAKYLRMAETEEVVIARHGKPAEVLIDFESEENWLERDPKFLHRIETARKGIREGRGVRLGDLGEDPAYRS